MARGGARSTSFKPGVSGNPGGKPKNPEKVEARKLAADVRAKAKELGEEALDALKDVMKSQKAPPAARVAAATAILDRGYGKPTQTIEAQVSLLDKMTDDEQRALLSVLDALATDEGEPAGGTSAAHH